MRWSNLTLDADEAARLPGYRDEAVVRRFDAPEALETRFYEVRARSALNRVPEASRMPFRWTINPYRGCSHACVYCLAGDTPILMADGRTNPLADLRVGDAIYGTAGDGAHREYVRTEVLAHWSSVKPAYRVLLADGRELVASADHRFLSADGWKHVAAVGRAAEDRPRLTEDDALLGIWWLTGGPRKDVDYVRGYTCATVRADAQVDALPPAVGARAMPGAQSRPDLGAVPYDPSDEWCRGFLAGAFDVAGVDDGSTIRIVHPDLDLTSCVGACLKRFHFSQLSTPRRGDRSPSVEVLGCEGRSRFLHVAEPGTVPPFEIEGLRVDADSAWRVAAVEPLGLSLRLYDITTGTGDFIANGIVSHNCFARPTHRYLDFDAGRDFEREIVVKVNVPEVVRRELARPSWRGEHVALGTNTDPYQWVEGRYKLMPGIWEAMRDAANPCSVLTKSPLLLRDLPLMKEIAQVADFTASLSVPTLDEKAWRATEPHTPNPRARLEAVAELNRQGIPTGVLIAPLMPGINDAPEQIEPLLELAAEAGAVSVGGIALHLRGDVRGVFMDWLRSMRPDLVERYEELYARGAYGPRAERERLSALVRGRVRRTPAWRMRGSERAGRSQRTLPGARGGVAQRATVAGSGREQRAPDAGGSQQALF